MSNRVKQTKAAIRDDRNTSSSIYFKKDEKGTPKSSEVYYKQSVTSHN